jgi:hypothetical protein
MGKGRPAIGDGDYRGVIAHMKEQFPQIPPAQIRQTMGVLSKFPHCSFPLKRPSVKTGLVSASQKMKKMRMGPLKKAELRGATEPFSLPTACLPLLLHALSLISANIFFLQTQKNGDQTQICMGNVTRDAIAVDLEVSLDSNYLVANTGRDNARWKEILRQAGDVSPKGFTIITDRTSPAG